MFFRRKKKECNVILSAGGIRALAQVGALQALEEGGWKIKSICGISAGAIVATFYASGCPLDKMIELCLNTDFNKFKKWNFPRFNEGIFKFQGLGNWVYDNSIAMGHTTKCELNIATCSLSTGNKRIFTDPRDRDTLSTAIEATCCIPIIFKPVQYQDEFYADGALWSSAPIHFYEKSKIPTIVIHVQNSHAYIFKSFNKPMQTLYRVFEVFQINRMKGLKKRVANKPICIVEPDLGLISPLAFASKKEVRKSMIELGKRCTQEAISKGICSYNAVPQTI